MAATVAAAHATCGGAPRTTARSRPALQRAFQDAVRPAPVPALATVDLMAEPRPGDHPRVARPHSAARIEDDDRTVRIVLPRKTIALPAEASAAVHALRAQDHPAGALPGLDQESSLVVSRRLLREGVLVPR